MYITKFNVELASCLILHFQCVLFCIILEEEKKERNVAVWGIEANTFFS